MFNKFRNFVFLFRSSSLLNLKKKMKKKKIGFDYIKTLGSLVASRFIAFDGSLSHSSVCASDVFGEPNLFCTPAAVPTRHNRPNRHSPLYTVCIECLGREDAHATWPFLSASNNDRRQFECHTKRSYRRLYSRVRANGKQQKNSYMLVFRLHIRRSVYARPPPLSRRICETFKRRKQKNKNCEKQILTGRAIEKKNKWNYGREGLWPSFYI